MGLEQWALKIVPTLFPFMMLSSIILESELDIEIGKILSPLFRKIYLYSPYGLYAAFMGFLCGFPMGAKVVSELVQKNRISKKEAQSLLSFCNNISPAYFVGIIIPILHACKIEKIYPFIFGMYGIPAIYGCIMSQVYNYSNKKQSLVKNETLTHNTNSEIKIPSILKNACINNTQSLIILCGYIMISNATRILLLYIPIDVDYKNICSCFIEIISGIQNVYLSSLDIPDKILWIMISLCFGGLSCILQTSSFIETSGLSITNYIKHKLILTFVSMVYYSIIIRQML